MRTAKGLAALALTAAVLAACGGSAATPAPTEAPTAAPVTPAPTEAPTAAPTEAPTPDACAPENLATKTAGTLTIGTDNPAYPPYFDFPADGETAATGWDLGDPTNGRGFESAVAYAVAKQLGFDAAKVTWLYTGFDASYAPGEKAFDFDINQVSWTAERAAAVDMTDGYYTVNQALVAPKDSALAKVTSIAALKDFKLGAMAATTSYAFIADTIAPTTEASAYDSNDAAIAALTAGQVDGIVVDLPTAFFITAVQYDKGAIVGQFAAPEGADAEHFSMVLQQGSPLTACVNKALASLKADGTLDSITQTWLADKANAPVFQP